MGKPFVLTFTDPDELEALIDEYFQSRWDTRHIISNERDENGDRIRIEEPFMRPPTMAGLARHLGVVRETLWHMQRRGRDDPEDLIQPVIARALNRIAEWSEEALYTREGVTGARFTLEVNHGYGREQGSGGGAGFSQNILPPRTDTETRAIPKWDEED
jgi:hypothetical protein